MDKNTVYGLIMMGIVLFGFMYLNKSDQQKIQQELQEQAEKEKAQQAEQAERMLTVDSISPAELAGLPAILRQAGVASNDSTAGELISYNTPTVALSFNGEKIDGTVNAADTVLTYDAVVNSSFGDDLTIENRRVAISNLRAAISEAERYRGFARHLAGKEEYITLKNNVMSLDIATHGGHIAQATLLEYFNYFPNEKNEVDTTNVNVLQKNQHAYNFILTSATQRFDTGNFFFKPEQVNDSTVLMKLDLGKGAYWGLKYTLADNSYIVKMDVVQHRMETVIPPSVATIDMVWHQNMGRNELSRTFEERNSGLCYKYIGDSPDELDAMGDQKESLNQSVKWIAFKNQFFSSVMIPDSEFVTADLESKDLKGNAFFVKELTAKTTMNYSSTNENPASFSIFIGPNLYPLLSSLDDQINPEAKEGLDLTSLIPLGWPIIRWISTLIIIPVFTFLSQFIGNYGIIILLLTLFIKLILFPLTYKSLISQARMRLLAPEIQAINEKYPGQENAMTRNQKTMALYSKAGASPFSGCLPMVLQMPILIAMFWFFPSCIELRGESFLWATNLAAPDVIFTLPFTIPWYGNHVSLFCLLMTATNIIYTRINMQNQPSSSSMPGMKWMMYLMPVMFLFLFNDYASGLSYYYFLSLLITILQTYIFRMFVNEDKMRAQMAQNAAKPRKKSGFMARLEEAQRQQQAMLREQQKKNGKGRR